MQIRPAATAAPARPQFAAQAQKRAVAQGAVPTPVAQGVVPRPVAPVKARNADNGFGSEIFQSLLYSLTNLGQIVPLPGGIAGLIQALGGSTLGIFNIVMGGMNAFKDYKGLSKAGNTIKSDDYTRLAGSAAIIAGGALLLAGAAVPVLAVVGAGLGFAGFVTRAVGVWNDQTRW